MNFLAPAAFILVLLLPVIVLMYLLKLRRTEQVVSSIYLWRKMVRDIEANAPWQRLRRNWLLILQLLFLISLIFALARPFFWVSGYSGQSAILIIDASASMSATDVSPNRLEAAKNQARQIINNLPEEERITIISAGIKAQVMVSSSLDRSQIHQAIDDIHTQMGWSDFGVALQLASAIYTRQPDTQIIILSDGRVILPEVLSIKGNIRYSPIGISGENQAISLLTAQISPGGKSVTAFAQATNYGSTYVKSRIALYADGQLYNVYDLDLPPAESLSVLAEGLPENTRVVEARIQKSENSTDYLADDNQAWAVIQNNQPAQVNLVTQGNLFLETAFSLLSNIDLAVINTSDQVSLPSAELTIFDAFIPLTATLPTGNLFFIAPPRSTDYFTISGSISQPIPLPTGQEESLLNHITLDGINILDAALIDLPDWARPVIVTQIADQSRTAPLLFVGETDNRKVAVLTFDLRHSDLPLQIAFPLLLANLTQWLAPGASGEIPNQVSPGEPLVINLPALNSGGEGISEVTVTLPDGTKTRLEFNSGQVIFAATQQLGLYTIDIQQATSIPFAVNLFSPEESTINPADNLPITGIQSSSSQPTEEMRARREWWRFLALIALIILMIEWLVYQRPALAFLSDKLRQPFRKSLSKNSVWYRWIDSRIKNYIHKD